MNSPVEFSRRIAGRPLSCPWACIAVAGVLVWARPVAAQATESVEPGERIAIRDGRFAGAESGVPFTPLGVNYYRTNRAVGEHSHAAFCPGQYDAEYVERMMAYVASKRWNTIRAFHGIVVGPAGLIESPDSREINPAYAANVVHFLRTARAHGVRVIFTLDTWLPEARAWANEPLPAEWEEVFGATPPGRYAINGLRLTLRSVRIRAAELKALIGGIRKEDPTLLAVVLAWEIENECRFAADHEPLASRAACAFGGKPFDLSTDDGAQAFMNEVTTAWASACADAVHAADQHALVSASVFTFAAVGRGRPGTLSQDKTADPRVPCDPCALLESRLDFIDIHIYAGRGPTKQLRTDLTASLQTVDFVKLRAEARRLGKPILAGEFGVPVGATRRPPVWTDIHHDVGQALLADLAGELRKRGFAGALYWHYGNADSKPDDEFPAMELHRGYADRFRAAWMD